MRGWTGVCSRWRGLGLTVDTELPMLPQSTLLTSDWELTMSEPASSLHRSI